MIVIFVYRGSQGMILFLPQQSWFGLVICCSFNLLFYFSSSNYRENKKNKATSPFATDYKS